MNTIEAGPGRQRPLKFDREPSLAQSGSADAPDRESAAGSATATDQTTKTAVKQIRLADSGKAPEPEPVQNHIPGASSPVAVARNNTDDEINRGKDKEKEKEQDDAKVTRAREALLKRYLVVENKYYLRAEAHRDSKEALAFVDKGRRLATSHDDPDIARSMVMLAEAKRWASIKVKGSTAFRREIWLEASLRGIDVDGYKANDLDKARLEELRATQSNREVNEIVEGAPRTRRPGRETEQQVRTNVELSPAARDVDQLTPRQETAVETVKQVLRARGDSEQAVAMAVEVARERFLNDRVYAGKIVEFGAAPYLHKKENDENFFIKLATKHGERTIWGEELSLALQNSNAGQGDAIAIAYLGKKNVTVSTRERDEKGNRTEKVVHKPAVRNDWAVMPLEDLRVEARERLLRSADLSENIERKSPVINVYDSKAPRPTDRDLEHDRASPKPRPRDRHVSR